jgi:acyl-CoA reductase-like NAD-dependent aldehyde dehydrogenase
VLNDADIGKVIEGVMFASFFNTGQVCTAASRLLVPSELHDRIAKEVGERASKLRLGDPFSDPDLGPLTTRDQLEKVSYYSSLGRDEGANLECGGY